MLCATPVMAVIMWGATHVVDFTDAKKVTNQAKWSEDLELVPEGLQFKNATARTHDSWVVTEPEGVGLSWRPLQGATVRVVVEGLATPQVQEDGNPKIPDGGRAFVRFGPDRKHWSSWQALTYEMNPHREKGALFTGYVGVISSDRAAYEKLLMEYFKLDVPWTSDEEATVKWILKNDPGFFEKVTPFVGWVQFRYEFPLRGQALVKRFSVRLSSAMGGIHAEPKNDADKAHKGPWRFRADEP